MLSVNSFPYLLNSYLFIIVSQSFAQSSGPGFCQQIIGPGLQGHMYFYCRMKGELLTYPLSQFVPIFLKKMICITMKKIWKM